MGFPFKTYNMELISSSFDRAFFPSEQLTEIQRVNQRLADELRRQMDDVVIEGLERKGFEFKHRGEMEIFIRERCHCEDNIAFKQRIYFVDKEPFLFYDYSADPNLKFDHDDNKVMISASAGKYRYL